MRPDEKRQAQPGHSGRPHFVNRDDEVQARQDRGEPGNESSGRSKGHVTVGLGAAVRSVESPAGIDPAHDGGH